MSTDEYDAYLLWKLSAQQHLDYFRKDVKNLKAENEKLREDLEDQEGYDQMLRDRLRQQTELHVKAETENAKLRELCADMWRLIEDLDATPYVTERQGNNPAVTWLDEDWSVHESCKKRIRELGVEVDE